MHLLPAAGPRNPPLNWPARLVVVAWVELLAVLAAAGYLALLVWMVASPEFAWYVCMDGGPNCHVDPVTAWDVVTVAAIQAVAIVGAVAALVVTRRHSRGRSSRAAALGALAGSFALFAAVEVVLWRF
jgi:hypothetical protein